MRNLTRKWFTEVCFCLMVLLLQPKSSENLTSMWHGNFKNCRIHQFMEDTWHSYTFEYASEMPYSPYHSIYSLKTTCSSKLLPGHFKDKPEHLEDVWTLPNGGKSLFFIFYFVFILLCLQDISAAIFIFYFRFFKK